MKLHFTVVSTVRRRKPLFINVCCLICCCLHELNVMLACVAPYERTLNVFLTMFLLLTVRFSNGSVKNADKLDFTMYKNTEDSNPRKKSRRILVRKRNAMHFR